MLPAAYGIQVNPRHSHRSVQSEDAQSEVSREPTPQTDEIRGLR